jgi:hypothetical protein
VLSSHYGFTHAEPDFIINYDIKYRLGQDAEEDGGDRAEVASRAPMAAPAVGSSEPGRPARLSTRRRSRTRSPVTPLVPPRS